MYVLVRRHVRRDPDISQMKQSFPTSTWTSFHPKAGVEFLADALSFLTKLTCYFQFRYEVVSQRFTMSKQVTLFGAVLEKKPFFAEGTASATSGYYAAIEALWTLDKRPGTSGNRKDFLMLHKSNGERCIASMKKLARSCLEEQLPRKTPLNRR